MSKNILHILSDVLTAAANQIRTAAIEADEAEQTAAVEAPAEAAAAVENAPQEAEATTEQEAAAVETLVEQTDAAAEIITEVKNVTKNKPNDFDERLKKAMEILKGRV